MADFATNEFLNTENARKEENDLFSAIGKLIEWLHVGVEEGPYDDRVQIVDEIEGPCAKCKEMGYTWYILTKIPAFRDIYLLAYYCDTCHFSSNEVQPASTVQDHGSEYIFRIDKVEDLERKIVKSDTAIFRVEELDIEMPACRGRLTNIEGMLSEILRDLEAGQKQRKKNDPELWAKYDQIIQPLLSVLLGHEKLLPCTITLDDPAGNSWIERAATDSKEQEKCKYVSTEYVRTPQQNEYLGMENGDAQADPAVQVKGDEYGLDKFDGLGNQTYDWRTKCPGCASDKGHTIIQTVNIPHFKQVVLRSNCCEACDYNSSEVKIGGERSTKGQRIWIEIKGHEDFKRDILKSDTCRFSIPEYDCSMEPGSVGARFTTVAELLLELHEQQKKKGEGIDDNNETSDPKVVSDKQVCISPGERLSQAIIAESQFTILLEDPVHDSWCQSTDDVGPGLDSQIRCEEYERTKEDYHLGLNVSQT